MNEDRINAGLARLRARSEAEATEASQSRSIFGPWPEHVRPAIADWPRSPIVSAELGKARCDSYVCYGEHWPMVVKELSDVEVAELLKAWLSHHAVRRAIARFVAKKSHTTSKDVMPELLKLRDDAEDRLIEHEERQKLLGKERREGEVAEGEDEGEVRGRAARGDGEQPSGEGDDEAGVPGEDGAADEGRAAPEAVLSR